MIPFKQRMRLVVVMVVVVVVIGFVLPRPISATEEQQPIEEGDLLTTEELLSGTELRTSSSTEESSSEESIEEEGEENGKVTSEESEESVEEEGEENEEVPFEESEEPATETSSEEQISEIAPFSSTETISGTSGTAPWTIIDGVLTIGAGQLQMLPTSTSEEKSPWHSYASSITEVRFSGNVVAPQQSGYLFYQFTALKRVVNADLLDTSNVVSMLFMFGECKSLTTIDVSNWDLSKNIDLRYMFYNCESLTALDVSNWNISAVTNWDGTFRGCKSLKELDLSHWRMYTSHLGTINGYPVTRYIFRDCVSLEKLSLSSSLGFYGDNLPAIDTTSGLYTGRWVNIGNGTQEKPEKSRIFNSSSSLMNNVHNLTSADTYIWEKALYGELRLESDKSEVAKKDVVNWTVTIKNTGGLPMDLSLPVPNFQGFDYVQGSSVMDGVAMSDSQLGESTIAVTNVAIGTTKTWTFQTKENGSNPGSVVENVIEVVFKHNEDSLTKSATKAIRIGYPDIRPVPPTSGSVVDLVKIPEHFTFEESEVKNVTQSVSIKNSSYDPYTVNAGLFTQVKDERGTNSGWRLTAKLGLFTQTSYPTKNLTTETKISFQPQLEKVTNPATPQETITTTPSGAIPTLSTQVEVKSDNDEVPIVISPLGVGEGTWNVRIPLNSIQLEIPASMGVANKEYRSTMTWTLYDAP